MRALQLNDKVMRVLQIRADEKNIVFRCLLLSFLIGCILSYIAAVPMGIFLSTYSSKDLPLVYISIATCSGIFGMIYTFFESRISFYRLIIGLNILMGLIILLFWFGLVTVGNKISIFLIVWALVAYELYGFALWVVYNRIYKLQQGKRLFGLLGASQSFGGVFSGFTLPILVHFINTKQVLLLIGALTFIGAWLYFSLSRSSTISVDEEGGKGNASDDISVKTIMSNRYILKIFAMSALAVFIFYTIDLLFNTSAAARYPSEESLTSFLGFFYGIISASCMIINGAIYNQIMKRFGVIISLLVRPVITGMVALILIIANIIPPLIGVIFWFITNMSLMDQSLSPTIFYMGKLLLMQPFPPNLRAAVQSKNDTLIIPLATLLISLLLMMISHTFGIHTLMFALMVLLFSVLCIIVILSLRSDYLNALNKAIANRYYNSEINTPHLDKNSWALLDPWLSSKYADEVVYALNIIEKVDDKKFNDALGLVLKSNSDVIVREFTLNRIHEHQLLNHFPHVLSLLETDNNDTIRAKVIKSLAILDYRKSHKKIQTMLDDSSLLVVSQAIIAIFRYGDLANQKDVLKRLTAMALSDAAELRKTSAYIIGEINIEEGNNLLKQLIKDKSSSVRGETLTSIIKTQNKDLIGALIKNINLVIFRRHNPYHFLELKELISAKIKEVFPLKNRLGNVKLLYILGSLKTQDAQNVLEQVILNGNSEYKQIALHSYIHMQPETNQEFLEAINDEIIKTALSMEQKHQDLMLTPIMPLTELLRDSLQRRINLLIEKLILLLTIYHHNRLIEKAQIAFEMGDEVELSYAIELLQSSVNDQQKKIISPILNKIYFSELVPSAININESVLRRNLIAIDDEPLTLISCAACIYIIKKAALKNLYPDLELLKKSNSIFIRETLDWLETSYVS